MQLLILTIQGIGLVHTTQTSKSPTQDHVTLLIDITTKVFFLSVVHAFQWSQLSFNGN